MTNKVINKIVRATKIGTIKRAVKYYDYSKMLMLDGAFVTNIDGMEIKKNDLFSTCNDPKIFIRFNSPVKKILLNFQVKSNYINDDIDLFYSGINKKEANFSYNECYKVGKTNGKKINKSIIFPTPVRFIRLDLGNHASLIKINDFKLIEEKVSEGESYNEYTQILSELEYNQKEKMVIVTHALNETGAPLLAFNIAKSFKEKKYDVFVISLSDGGLEEKFSEENIRLISLHQDSLSKRVYDSKQLENIIKILKSKGYNNVITNTIISGITAPLFKKYNFKIISLIHEMGMSIELYDMKQGGRDITMYSDKVIFPDEVVKKDFYGIFNEDQKKSIICPQGLYKLKEEIQLNKNKIYQKYNIPQNSKIILGSGTADYRKGIDLFLFAAQKLISLEEDEEYHFIWAGKIYNDELKEWIKLQFKRYGIENRFHNIEFIKDSKEYQNLVSCSDAFWLTSREDPFPSVMIEALEYNTPVIAFKNSGGANTLLNNDRGILIDNFDANSMAEETKKIIEDKEHSKKMLENAQKYIKKELNFNKYIERLEKEFSNLYENDKVTYADVSVIVPNYNYEDFLPVRLNSIINQTIKPKEIILLDDVSKDDSVLIAKPILENAKKKYGIDYKIVVNTVNNGCFRQWLKGIDLASQPYIWIAEADDYAQPNFIEILMPKFSDKKVVLAYAQSKVINEYCEVVDYKYTDYTNDLSEDKWNSDFKEEGITQIKKYFSRKNIIPNVSSTIIRKCATDGMKEYLDQYNFIGDWLAYIFILSKGYVSYSSKTLNGHRRHSKSIIARTEKSIGFIEETLKIKKFIVENFDLNDTELNNLVLSMEELQDYYEKISNNEKLKDLYISLIKKINSKRKKQNIMIIIPDLNVGGGQTVAIRIANNFIKYYNVFLVNARPNLETSIMKNMISDKVKLLDKSGVNDLRLYSEILNLKGVISFIWWSDKLAYQAFGDKKIPCIISMHGCYEMLLHNPNVDEYFNSNVKDILNRANKIVYTANKNKEIFKVLNMENNSKISKIDNGFVLGDYPKKRKEELGIKESDFVFGLVARAIPEKGYEEAIKALIALNKTEENKSHLILVGASAYVDELKKKYNEKYIHFIDEFSFPNEWIGWEELFDVGLLPSYFKSESLPTVIVEYLFLNKPVIATDIAEIKSMLQNGKTEAGITISLKNGKADVELLTSAMKKLKNDKKYYNNLKENTKVLSKRFDMDMCINKYKNLIEECNDEK
jgi:glycosyltransferase involved in cell wall biosynthesis